MGFPRYELAVIFAPNMKPKLGLYPMAGNSANPDFLLSAFGFDLKILAMIRFTSVVSLYCLSCASASMGKMVQKNKRWTNLSMCNDTKKCSEEMLRI